MLKIENTEVYGWQAAIRGLRNPMNSWDRSDSGACYETDSVCPNVCKSRNCPTDQCVIGEKDHDLMMKMNTSSEQSKYRRMITVTFDIIAPLYWWKEFDTYKVGTVCSSCSTMHKIHTRDLTIKDFSSEKLLRSSENEYCLTVFVDNHNDTKFRISPEALLQVTITCLNNYRKKYLETKEKVWWEQMIQLLPSSYNQRRTIQLNYEVLASIYRQRKNHKLDEWHTFCDWIKTLPYSELITGEEK